MHLRASPGVEEFSVYANAGPAVHMKGDLASNTPGFARNDCGICMCLCQHCSEPIVRVYAIDIFPMCSSSGSGSSRISGSRAAA